MLKQALLLYSALVSFYCFGQDFSIEEQGKPAETAIGGHMRKREMPPPLDEFQTPLQVSVQVRLTKEGKEIWSGRFEKSVAAGRPAYLKLTGGNVSIRVHLIAFKRPQSSDIDCIVRSEAWVQEGERTNYLSGMEKMRSQAGSEMVYLPLGQNADPQRPNLELIISVKDALAEEQEEAAP